jgi:hypothetical protein
MTSLVPTRVWLTIPEVAAALDKTWREAWALVFDGPLPGYADKDGGVLVRSDDLEAFACRVAA